MTTVPADTAAADVVATTGAVVATRARSTKVAALADLLARTGGDEEIPIVVAFLSGTARQGRIGVGWRTVAAVEAEPAGEPSLDPGGRAARSPSWPGCGPGSRRPGPTCWWPCCPGPRRASRTCCGGCWWASCATGRWSLVTDATAKAYGVPLATVAGPPCWPATCPRWPPSPSPRSAGAGGRGPGRPAGINPCWPRPPPT